MCIDRQWQCVVKKAGITDFRFHDLRHTSASWLIGKVIPYARNARIITQAAVDKVAASLQEFGFSRSCAL